MWLALGTLSGCSNLYRWDVTRASGVTVEEGNRSYYIVEEGDTLFSIAFQAGTDYRKVAQWNGIRWPYRIYPNQKLRLFPPAISASRQEETPQRSKYPETGKPAKKNTSVVSKKVIPVSQRVRWQWPLYGPILNRYSKNGIGRNGMDIGGKLGQPIRAAAAGRVVYSGSGLRGYGKLIIVKHNDVYLSAYGHNRKLLVKEGETLRAGQVIAELGDTDADRPKLHFEIRRDGEPIDPQRLLPKR